MIFPQAFTEQSIFSPLFEYICASTQASEDENALIENIQEYHSFESLISDGDPEDHGTDADGDPEDLAAMPAPGSEDDMVEDSDEDSDATDIPEKENIQTFDDLKYKTEESINRNFTTPQKKKILRDNLGMRDHVHVNQLADKILKYWKFYCRQEGGACARIHIKKHLKAIGSYTPGRERPPSDFRLASFQNFRAIMHVLEFSAPCEHCLTWLINHMNSKSELFIVVFQQDQTHHKAFLDSLERRAELEYEAIDILHKEVDPGRCSKRGMIIRDIMEPDAPPLTNLVFPDELQDPEPPEWSIRLFQIFISRNATTNVKCIASHYDEAMAELAGQMKKHSKVINVERFYALMGGMSNRTNGQGKPEALLDFRLVCARCEEEILAGPIRRCKNCGQAMCHRCLRHRECSKSCLPGAPGAADSDSSSDSDSDSSDPPDDPPQGQKAATKKTAARKKPAAKKKPAARRATKPATKSKTKRRATSHEQEPSEFEDQPSDSEEEDPEELALAPNAASDDEFMPDPGSAVAPEGTASPRRSPRPRKQTEKGRNYKPS